ncbi:MAG: Asp-tRNA(Asn)/Glu-tRNA(Gln) amidotransferase subunit GatC [Cyclobacteriaceae bacterium]|nr:Asp-tRNA(Asn)/Glu-tRNA(Gln) amidotransferase subunit GatC [Cyclobacteriaceae bacterium]MCH8517135.1 Asp-tRNA(Asn)/Glu-tRNA(Gln) amidotransferase subunit GatC [Cyclobacteriaceae bacterium]
MKIDKKTIHNLAHLSRLRFDDSDAEKMEKDLNGILNWVEQLNEVDTDGVEPLSTMTWETNQMREDIVGEHLPREKGLKNAPQKDSNYFRVPKVKE